MKIRKVLCFVLATACLLLCACGSSAGSSPAPAATAAPVETAEVTAAEAVDEAAEEALEEAEAAAAEAVDAAVEETIEELPATAEYDIAIEKMKTLFDGELEDFPVGNDYVITVPAKWWAIDGQVLAEFDLDHTYAALTTVTVPGFTGFSTDDIIEMDEFRESLLEGIMSELEEAEAEEYRDITVNGLRVLTQKATYLVTGERFTANFVLLVDDEGLLNSLTFLQSERAKSDYTERFDTILNTLRLKEQEEEGPEMMNIDAIPILYQGRFPDYQDGSSKRLATLLDNEFKIEYALPYYKENFRNDDQTHYIVNYVNTVEISKAGDYLTVLVHEYVEDEETSEQKIGSGDVISAYAVNIKTGEAEKLS